MVARDYALGQLDQRALPGWPAGQMRRGSPPSPADPRDRALAEQILVGTIKNLLHLQHLIRHYSGRSLRSIDPLTQKILAIGLYQIRFLDRIHPAVAVDEAVEQSRRVGRGKASGFVNAILRKAVNQPPPELPDPAHDPAGYAELALSHPRELFDRLAEVAGVEGALAICEHNNRPAPVIVRLSAGHDVQELAAEGIEVTPHERPGMYLIEPARPAHLASLAERGIAQAQDPTSAAIVPVLGVTAGTNVLDRCAGLGTKTMQLREKAGEPGLVVAVDPSAPRMRRLRQLVQKRGLSNVRIRQIGMLEHLPPEDPRAYQFILIDAPCSNSGVLARRPEARYAQDDAALTSLARLQDRILDDTAGWLAPGGRLVYSTCSIWPEENQQRIAAFLTRQPGLRLASEQSALPSTSTDPTQYHDGGYWALLERP